MRAENLLLGVNFLRHRMRDGFLDAFRKNIDHISVQIVLLTKLSSQSHRLIARLRTDIHFTSILQLNLQFKQRALGTALYILFEHPIINFFMRLRMGIHFK